MRIKDIKENISEWDHIDIAVNATRFYFKPRKKRQGFEYIVLDFVSCESADTMWEDTCEVAKICWGTALWDGNRHMYFGESGEWDIEEAYWYYIPGGTLRNIGKVITMLESIFCADPEVIDDIDEDLIGIKWT